MCDFSLEAYKSVDAQAGDDLEMKHFRGFSKVGGDESVAVCLRPGTQLIATGTANGLTFADGDYNGEDWKSVPLQLDHTPVTFLQLWTEQKSRYHDCLQTVDGGLIVLGCQAGNLSAKVLQLPALQAKEPGKKEIEEQVAALEAAEAEIGTTAVRGIRAAFERIFG